MLAAPPQSATVATVQYRYASVRSLDAACVRPAASWLSSREQAELDTWPHAERRRSWLQGRMLAKQLIAADTEKDLPFTEIEILSRSATGRPRVWCHNEEQSWPLSISHTGRGVLVAMRHEPNTSVGVDLTACQPLRDNFVRLWFTPAEIDWLRSDTSPALAAFIWATKESLFKACNQGEGFDPRQIEVFPQGCYRYRGVELEDVRLQSWTIDQQIAVVVTLS